MSIRTMVRSPAAPDAPGTEVLAAPLRGRWPAWTTLFLAGGAGAVAGALANVVLLVSTERLTTLRDLELLAALLGTPGNPHFVTIELGPQLEALLGRSFELAGWVAVLEYAACAVAVSLLLIWALCVVLALGSAALSRLVGLRASSAEWNKALTLAAFAVGCAPLILAAVHRAFRGQTGLIAAVTLAVVGVGYALLLRGLRPEQARRFLRAAGASALALAGVIWGLAGGADALRVERPPRAVAAPASPNILLVSIDSLRRDHVHAYGYQRETTPTIDRLAREGTRFATVASPTSWTLPAHLSLLTSLPPEVHGVVGDGMRLREDALFLGEVLWEAGYSTAGIVSAPYLDSVYGFSQGFDHYDDYTIARRSHEASHQGSTSPALYDLTMRWLDDWDEHGRRRPFFLFLHMWDVHYDYSPPPPYDTLFDPTYTGTVTGDDFETGTQVHAGMNRRDLAHVVALYDGEIGYTDLYVGRIIDRLAALGLLDQTLIVVTADHGDEFFEHGQKGHGKALYDESILVPLVMRYPARVPSGAVVPEQVRLIDVAPTILDLAGVPRPPRFGQAAHGGALAAQDLTPWIVRQGLGTLPELVAFEDLEVGLAPTPLAAVRTQSSKLITGLRPPVAEELYDLTADPGEKRNLSGTSSAGVALRDQLDTWRSTAGQGTALAEHVELDEAHKERLRALGYLK